ncbi:uncharacterized protein [Coffea arabica]|uniref:DNA-directed RNA polymerase III subunit RPC4-like n=1 Tax=Coffea arabica TaxID=13443 RepID=A0A6P6W7J6_COFAR|nr:uncharacterized protein LOC113730201 [Coffea arabica]XP_027110531.1 uncharacterized protein LOC113730205 [Coffea arabica]
MEPNLSPSTPRRVKFAPKGPPPKRKSTPLQPKTEVAGGGDHGGDDEINESLLRKVNEHLTRRWPQAEKKSSVQVAFSHGVASSTSLRTYGSAKEGSGDRSNGTGLRDSAADTMGDIHSLPSTSKIDWMVESSEDATVTSFKQKKREYKEPWDYNHSYYPVTLPIRRPYSGNPEVLDREEFGEAKAASEYDESAINSASDLGLLEEVDGEKMLFLQFPANLPFVKRESGPGSTGTSEHASASMNHKHRAGSSRPGGSVAPTTAKGKEIPGSFPMVSGDAKGKEMVNSSVSSVGTNKNVCSLEELPPGFMGKILVFKSGAVKLKLGDMLYDVSPGSNCAFAQDIVAINTSDKHCCNLGEVSKRAVVTPDIDHLLTPVIYLT